MPNNLMPTLPADHTLDRLRQLGWTVNIAHGRRFADGSLGEVHLRHGMPVLPHGGTTLIRMSRGFVGVETYTKVNPKDCYNKKLGVALCLSRLPDFVWQPEQPFSVRCASGQ